MTNVLEQSVANHYTSDASVSDKLAAMDANLVDMGKDPAQASIEDLAPFDQLHTRGPAATKEMASLLDVSDGNHVVDVGCGMGGPARHLSSLTGCRVSAIDLTPEFIGVAQALNTRLGMEEQVDFQVASALELPFDDARFDAAWTLHMSMNVEDKPRMYAEIFRVLKPGGRFALYDPIAGAVDAPNYPAPWARVPETSFLLTAAAMQATIEAAGFETMQFDELNAAAMAWFTELDRKNEAMPPALKEKLAARRSPGFAAAMANHRENIAQNRISLLRGVFRKP